MIFENERGLSYSFKPSAFGAAWEFEIKPQGLFWRAGMRSGVIGYDKIKRVRLSFRPVTMQNYRFQAEIWSAELPKIRIASSSWRGIVEQARQDEAYSAFIIELHRRLADARTGAHFSTGIPVVIYWAGVAIFGAVAIGLAALAVEALRLGEWAGAALIGAFLALFVWQLGAFFRRNHPIIYGPDQVPSEVLPGR